MKKTIAKDKRSRVSQVLVKEIGGKLGKFYLPLPYDSANRVIHTSVECIFSSEYFSRERAKTMLFTV